MKNCSETNDPKYNDVVTAIGNQDHEKFKEALRKVLAGLKEENANH